MGSDLSGRNGSGLDKMFPSEREAERKRQVVEMDREQTIRADERAKVLREVGECSKVTNAYGDRAIRGCDWQKLNGLDFEGQPLKSGQALKG